MFVVNQEQEILKHLIQDLQVDYAEIEHDLSIIMIVGENMKNQIGVTATATKALSENNINIQIMDIVNRDTHKEIIAQLDYEAPLCPDCGSQMTLDRL